VRSGWHTVLAEVLDAAVARSMIVETNDGIVATAGVVEGFAGAGATGPSLVIAALSTMVAGGIALAGARYAEEAAEREARLAVIEQERRQLALSPEQEMAELAALYEAKGLSSDLAREVASELSAANALAAHVEVEHGLSMRDARFAPLAIAAAAGLAFALGSAIPLLAVLIAPDDWRPGVVFVAVIVSLAITSLILARLGRTHASVVMVRSVLVGVTAMVLSLAAGSLFHP
jgi:VIT1/CCC1 family predicted Fe2+/Mn2+ transporter